MLKIAMVLIAMIQAEDERTRTFWEFRIRTQTRAKS